MVRRTVTMAAVIAVVGAGCSGGEQSSRRAFVDGDTGSTPEVSSDIVGWGDELDHYVVLTSFSPSVAGGIATAPVESGTNPGAGSALEGDLVVRSAGGDRVVTFGAGDLQAVVPTADEQDEVDRARTVSMVALVVVDLRGMAGAPGARYLYVDGELQPLATGTTREAARDRSAPSAIEADADIATALLAVDGVVAAERVGAGVISVSAERDSIIVDRLAAVPGVERVAPDVLLGLTDDPGQSLQWALRNTGDPAQAGGWSGAAGVDTGAPYAWDVATGQGVVVAVIDSGVQLDHPDLAPQLALNAADPCGNGSDDDANGFVDDCRGWDFGDGDQDPSPSPTAAKYEHGTHVSGIVAAARNGVGTVGIAPDARILPIKVSRADGAIAMSWLIAAIQYATDRGADVINLSLSTSPGVSRSAVAQLESAISYAGSRGVLVVAASGNNGVDITVNSAWPASFSDLYPFVITAGASTNSGQRASFSNYGSPIDVLAPGWWIYATWVGGGQNWSSGTSMAAPATAGAAAILLSQRDRSPAEVRAVLTGTGRPSPSGPLLDVAAAVGASRDGDWSLTYRGADALRADEPGGFEIDVAGRVPEAVALRMSVATIDQGQVAAVDGLNADVGWTGGGTAATTAANGAFGPFPIEGDLQSGTTMSFGSLSLPAGRYAFVAELLTATGVVTGAVQAAYFDVGSDGTVVSTTSPPGTVPTDPGTAPSTTAPGGTSLPGTTVATTSPPGGSGSGGTGSGGSGSAGSGSAGAGGSGSTATTLAGGGVVTTVASTSPTTTPSNGSPGSPPATATPTTSSVTTSSVTTSSVTSPATTSASTTSTTSTAPVGTGGGTPTVTTTPTPPPDTSGDWSLTGMTPRWAPVSGGTRHTLTGRFPTWVPVYVWFGQAAVVRADAYPDRLEITAPAVPAPMVTDVVVRFRTSTSVELTLTEAFSYVIPSGGDGGGGGGSTGSPTSTTTPATNAPGTVAGGATTIPAPPIGTSQPGTTTTAPSGPVTTTPAVSPTTPPSSPPTTVATTAPTTVPVTGSGGSGSGGSWERVRGQLTLRPVEASSSLAKLSPATWPATGCATTCTARSL